MAAFLAGLLGMIVSALASILPNSPFASITIASDIQTWLGWANWLFPFGDCLTLTMAVIGLLLLVKVVTWIIDNVVKFGMISA